MIGIVPVIATYVIAAGILGLLLGCGIALGSSIILLLVTFFWLKKKDSRADAESPA